MSNNDKLFEALIKEAFEKYAEDTINESLPELNTADEYKFESNQKQVYDNVMKLVKKQQRKNRPKSWEKMGLMVALIATLVFTFAVNATAFRTFLFKTYVNIESDVLNISADYADFNNQYNKITKFENKNELIIPDWLPNEANLVKVEDSYENIRLKYSIGDKYLEILEFNIEFEDNSSQLLIEDNIYKVEDIEVLGMDGKLALLEYESGIKNASVIFCSDKTKYVINSTLSEIELLSIITELKYFE